MSMEIWAQIKDLDWSLMSVSVGFNWIPKPADYKNIPLLNQ